MTLFDFIAKNLQTSQKHTLYKDKVVCLCLFRLEFTPIEQQVLLRLVFMSDPASPCKFKIKQSTSHQLQSTSLADGESIVLLEDMFNEQMTIGNRTVTNK